MNTIIKWITVLALTITSYVSSAQDMITFNTLEETINYAIENNNNLEAAQLDQDSIQA